MTTPHRLLKTLAGAAIILLLAIPGETRAADPPVGYIKTLSGQATVSHDSNDIPATPGQPVYMYDTLKTGSPGTIGVTFDDNTRIAIGRDTVFTIDEYVYQPKTMKLSFISRITRGTLHFISGNMAKLKPEAIAVETPGGTIGIRGTRFLVKVEKGE